VRTLDDLEPDLEGKRAVVRVDFNVPLDHGKITDDTRVRAALPTLSELRGRGAKLTLLAHLGRPKDREPELSLAPVAERLSGLMGEQVGLEDDAPVTMLENVRYEPGETKNDPELARRYAALGDVFVNDAFGTAHRGPRRVVFGNRRYLHRARIFECRLIRIVVFTAIVARVGAIQRRFEIRRRHCRYGTAAIGHRERHRVWLTSSREENPTAADQNDRERNQNTGPG